MTDKKSVSWTLPIKSSRMPKGFLIFHGKYTRAEKKTWFKYAKRAANRLRRMGAFRQNRGFSFLNYGGAMFSECMDVSLITVRKAKRIDYMVKPIKWSPYSNLLPKIECKMNDDKDVWAQMGDLINAIKDR